MIKHIWSILCERIITDKQTNLVSYLTAIEALTVAKLPINVPLLSFGCLWLSDSEQENILELRLIMVNPDKSEKEIVATQQIKFPGKRFRANIIMDGLVFKQSGTHGLRLERLNNKNWEQVVEIPFDINVMVQKQEAEKNPEVSKHTSTTYNKPVRKIRIGKKLKGTS
jgi:hypothetical protein